MTNRKNRRFLIPLGLAFILTVGLASLSGCGSQETSAGAPTDAGASAGEETSGAPATKEPGDTAAVSGRPADGSDEEEANGALSDYIKLLGLNKKELIDALGEKPGAADEGGLDFAKAGVRVWFDSESGTADQIFTANKDVDFGGVKIGDPIKKFEETFGKPVSDKNGDMHFRYGDVFLSVNYDTSTKETFALYILAKDF